MIFVKAGIEHRVRQRIHQITEIDAESCVSSASATSAQLLSGYVRFASGDPSAGTEAEEPTGSSLNLDITLALTSSHPAAAACFSAIF